MVCRTEWLRTRQDVFECGGMKRLKGWVDWEKKVQGLKNPTINGWEEEDELKRRLTAIGEGVDKSEDKLVLIEFISMAVIDNLYFQVPC